jgi:hypothetical protein
MIGRIIVLKHISYIKRNEEVGNRKRKRKAGAMQQV